MASRSRAVPKSDRLVRELVRRIRAGELSPGERLPSERVLAAEFTVSRTAVREALKVLQLSGNVETRSGEGSFVVDTGRSRGAQEAALGAGQGIVHNLERREALELASAVLAVSNATASDRLRLQAARLDLEEAVAAEDYERYLEVTFDLHELVARASHNAFLIESTIQVVDAVRDDEWALAACYGAAVAEYSSEVHRSIIDAVLDGDLDAVTLWVRRHYEDYPSLAPYRREAAPPGPSA